MKVILTNSDLVFRKEKEWINKPLDYGQFNYNTGNIAYPVASTEQYCRSTTGELSVEQDGVDIIPMFGEGGTSAAYIYLFDSNHLYIGYGTITKFAYGLETGVEVPNILNSVTTYKDGNNNEIDKATSIASTKYYWIALKKFEDNTGLYIKVR